MSRKRIFTGICILLVAGVVAIGVRAFLIAGFQQGLTPCVSNLRQIDAAKDQWMLEKIKTSNDVPTWDEILPYLNKSQIPVCPQGGTYTIGRIGDPPICSIAGHGHTLPKGTGR